MSIKNMSTKNKNPKLSAAAKAHIDDIRSSRRARARICKDADKLEDQIAKLNAKLDALNNKATKCEHDTTDAITHLVAQLVTDGWEPEVAFNHATEVK